MDSTINFNSIKSSPVEDPVLSGRKIFISEKDIISRKTLKTALDAEDEYIESAEIETSVDGRRLYIHEISYGYGNRFSVSEKSIMDVLENTILPEHGHEVRLRAYLTAASSVRCLQAFGGNMIPVSRFYYYYCELEHMLGQEHMHTEM